MSFTFMKLWKLILEQNINKTQLRKKAGISSATLSKLSKNENVSLAVIDKICSALKCDIGDIMEYHEEVENE